jgi:hypothetical protein
MKGGLLYLFVIADKIPPTAFVPSVVINSQYN